MGYHTDFSGSFKIDMPLTQQQSDYLKRFADSRRMKRDAEIVSKFKDPLRVNAGLLTVGDEGGYYVSNDEGEYGTDCNGQERDKSVVDYNKPPKGQPALWCQWVPDVHNDGTHHIEWDGGEKFYGYVEWIEYIIEHFLKPWGRTLNGEVEWEGEDRDDLGIIVIEDNVVTTKVGNITYE